MVFFTADTHFSHKNIIEYCHRPFGSVEEMDAALVLNWNKAVTDADDIYVLGDFAMAGKDRVAKYVAQLHGKIHLVYGSHDKVDDAFWRGIGVEPLGYLYELKAGTGYVTLCHYAMRSWPRSHYGAWHLYGHSHGHLSPFPHAMDVGVDANNYAPVSWAEVVARLGEQGEKE